MAPKYSFERAEHRALRDQIRRFAAKDIAPYAHQWSEAGEFPRDLYLRAARAGLLGIGFPEAVGGSGGDLSHVLAAAEEMVLAGHSVGTSVSLATHLIALPPVLAQGSQEQIQRFVPGVLSGEMISALAVTEPGGGSDVAAIATRAVRDGDHYLVNGAKTFITSGCRADLVITAVRTSGEGYEGISLLVIESSSAGFSVGKRLEKTGWWASDTAELHFADCVVPVANRIGEEGQGFAAIMSNFVAERLMLAGQCVAIAELALQESISYAQQRRAFGKSLSGFQVTRHKLAEMATRLAAARALTAECVAEQLGGTGSPVRAAMAKNCASDMCSFVCDQAVQIHGGYGYMREYLVERLYRDARLYPIGGGTREIMNEIISRAQSG